VEGTYSYTIAKVGDSFGNMDLEYTYHNHGVAISSNLNVTDHDNMKMMYISVHDPHNPPTVGSDYKITTGLYLRPGYIISLARSPQIHFVNSLIGYWTFYNQTLPAITAELAHGFTTNQRNMTDIFSSSNFNLSPIIQSIKTKFDKEKWTDYILFLAALRTGNIRFDTSTFMVTPPNNNGSLCIAVEYALGCGS
jgi:hypothetical protein